MSLVSEGPGVRFTATFVKNVSCGGKPVDLVDDRYPGLVLRVTPSGTRSWRLLRPEGGWDTIGYATTPRRRRAEIPVLALAEVLDIYDAARPGRRRASEQQRLEAKIEALERELEAARTAAGYGTSVRELAEEYMSEYSANHHSARYRKEVRRILDKFVLPAWEGRAAAAIRRTDVASLLRAVARDSGGIQGNRVKSAVSRMYRWAVSRQLVRANPAQGVEKVAPERKRELVLDDDELAAVLSALEARAHPDPANPRHSVEMSPVIADALLMSALTLQRREEVAAMTWTAVRNRPWWELSSDETKAGRAHRVFLSQAAITVLDRHESARFAGPYVFRGGRGRSPHTHPDTLSHAFADLREGLRAAGTVRRVYTEHDLRRTGRTGLSRLGVLPQVGDRILNHVVPGVRAHYDLYRWDAEVEQALRRWAEHLEGLLGARLGIRETRG